MSFFDKVWEEARKVVPYTGKVTIVGTLGEPDEGELEHIFNNPEQYNTLPYKQHNRMEDWQKRVIQEKKELDEKVARLDAFVNSDNFEKVTVKQRILLVQQLGAMILYTNVLGARIDSFS